MIKIVAIEPKVFRELDKHWKSFMNDLGPDRGMLICEFPCHWKRAVYDTCEGSFRQRALFEDFRMRLQSKAFVRRKGIAPIEGSILEQLEAEHRRDPFCVLALTESGLQTVESIERVIAATDLADHKAPQSTECPRTVDAFRNVTHMLLGYASKIRLVDPHFNPRTDRWREPLEAFLELSVAGYVQPRLIELHTACDTSDEESPEEWVESCRRLSKLLPEGLSHLTVVRWRAHPDRKERLHDRYILTELGGIQFGHGLDINRDPTGHAATTVTRLDGSHNAKLFRDFDRPSERYGFVDEVRVTARTATAINGALKKGESHEI